jgi:hypothetical protein
MTGGLPCPIYYHTNEIQGIGSEQAKRLLSDIRCVYPKGIGYHN